MGRSVEEVGLECLAVQVVAAASDVVGGRVVLAVGEVRDLARPVHLVLPLFHRRGCLGRGRSKEVLVEKDQNFEQDRRYLVREGFLHGLQAHGEGVGFLRRICKVLAIAILLQPGVLLLLQREVRLLHSVNLLSNHLHLIYLSSHCDSQ